MKLKDVIKRIRFATSTTDDLSGKTVQPLFSNASIVQQLKFALDKYASYTKALEAIWSTPVAAGQNMITMPPLILRTEGIRFINIFLAGRIYPLQDRDINRVFGNFPVPGITGVPNWLLLWETLGYLYPEISVGGLSGALAADISPIATTITLQAAVGLPVRCGRITIDDEKIFYASRSGANLIGCRRGVEDTLPAEHLQNAVVQENNMHIFYHKLHWEPVVLSDDRIDDDYANKEMEVCDEHLEIICNDTSYKLLKKVDQEKADAYKVDFDKWLETAKADIRKGRARITKVDDVRDPFLFEQSDMPYVAF